MATVVAFLALFIVLGGTAVAAKHYLITSTREIKPNVLAQLQGKAGPAGAAGPQGTPGAPGAQGPPGPSSLSSLTTVTGPTVEVPTGEVGSALAACPPGSHAVSGGGTGSIAGIDVSEMESNRQEWFIIIDNRTAITVKIHAEVQCAAAGEAVAARATGARPARSTRRASAEQALRQAALAAR